LCAFPGKVKEREITPKSNKRPEKKKKSSGETNFEGKLLSYDWRSDIFSISTNILETSKPSEGQTRLFTQGTHSDPILKLTCSKSLSRIITMGGSFN